MDYFPAQSKFILKQCYYLNFNYMLVFFSSEIFLQLFVLEKKHCNYVKEENSLMTLLLLQK